ncbi:hypothetical protein N9B72_00170 [Bacteriovoracaceae bacterium]|nr:hypothetical protein [Bacteriovoracaceae bacterium]
MSVLKKHSLNIVKFFYLFITGCILLSSIQSYHRSVIIISLFILNILWILKWNKRDQLNKEYIFFYIIVTLSSILLTRPIWESDYARYFIDGMHSAKGGPVYKIKPSKSSYKKEFPQAWKESQYNNFGSIYPGLSVYFFKLIVNISDENYPRFIYIFKIFALIIGLTIALLISKFKHNRFAYQTVTLAMLHPLLILEWYINLHFDFLFAFVILLLIYSTKQYLKIAALALGLHTKYLIFLFLPASGIKLRALNNYIWLLSCLFITSFLYHSKADFWAMLENIFIFGLDWEMNAGTFKLSQIILSALHINKNIIKISLLIQILLFAIFFVIHFKKHGLSKDNFWRLVLFFIITSPIVNPWYFTWILPLILVSSDRSNYKHFIILPIYLSYSYYFTSFFQYIFYIEHLLFFIILYFLVKSSWVCLEK